MLSRATGVITFADVLAHVEAKSKIATPELTELLDATDASTTITADEVRQLAVSAGLRHSRHGALAIVANRNSVYGMARMYAMLSEPVGATVEVFRDVDSAERWLDARARRAQS